MLILPFSERILATAIYGLYAFFIKLLYIIPEQDFLGNFKLFILDKNNVIFPLQEDALISIFVLA